MKARHAMLLVLAAAVTLTSLAAAGPGAAKQGVAISAKGLPNGKFVLIPLQAGALKQDSGTANISYGNPTEAASYFERALRIDPNSLQALLPYADLLYRRGQLQEAKVLVTRFNRLVPDGTPESLWLGVRIERKLGDRLAEGTLANQLRRRYAGSTEYQALQRGDYD